VFLFAVAAHIAATVILPIFAASIAIDALRKPKASKHSNLKLVALWTARAAIVGALGYLVLVLYWLLSGDWPR
jgi:hypothetical protein